MFRATTCPLSGENYYISAALVFVTLYGWRPVCKLSSIQPADQSPPTQSDKYQCRIDTVIFSWWWARGWPKRVEKRNKYINQNCAPSWTYLQDYTGMHGQQNIKKTPQKSVCKNSKCQVATLGLPRLTSSELWHCIVRESNSWRFEGSCQHHLHGQALHPLLWQLYLEKDKDKIFRNVSNNPPHIHGVTSQKTRVLYHQRIQTTSF